MRDGKIAENVRKAFTFPGTEQALPPWVKRTVISAGLFFLAGLILPLFIGSYFDSPMGAFVSNILAELVGLLIGVVLTVYVVERYMEESRLSRLAKQRKPYLEHLRTHTLLSIGLLSSATGCPKVQFVSPRHVERTVIESGGVGLELIEAQLGEIAEWFRWSLRAMPPESLELKSVRESLLYIADYHMRSSIDQVGPLSQLFEDLPAVLENAFSAGFHSVTARGLFSDREVTSVTAEGLEVLSTLGMKLVDLLVETNRGLGRG